MFDEPSSIRAVHFPSEYGTPGDEESFLSWGYVEERLRAAGNYWIATMGPGMRPHARPVDGVWVDGALCFGGSPETRWVRNLTANAAISVHLSSESEAIILEGTAEYITDPDHPLASPSAAASREKYPQYYSEEAPPFQPFWMLRPTTVYAWTLEGFPKGATRWRFERS
jgi:nitroimidazol reductase NimA-like FMN-containing flavoprotein (pyridoxamine 5'-phosphate oxidase superfamily)